MAEATAAAEEGKVGIVFRQNPLHEHMQMVSQGEIHGQFRD